MKALFFFYMPAIVWNLVFTLLAIASFVPYFAIFQAMCLIGMVFFTIKHCKRIGG